MDQSEKQNKRIANMTFASVYPHYVEKVLKKDRTEDELQIVIEWLTGYDALKQKSLIAEKVTFQTFFDNAKFNENANLITGLICGYRVEDIQNPLMQKLRYLDKIVDELAKGKKLEKIFRKPV